MTERYATTCPHCKQPLYLTLTLTKEDQKPASKPDALPVGDLESLLRHELGELLEVTPTEGKLIIQATTWLDTEDWRRANKLIKSAGGFWVPGGKESHWEVPT